MAQHQNPETLCVLRHFYFSKGCFADGGVLGRRGKVVAQRRNGKSRRGYFKLDTFETEISGSSPKND